MKKFLVEFDCVTCFGEKLHGGIEVWAQSERAARSIFNVVAEGVVATFTIAEVQEMKR